mgnify:CR=1 FL=1
MKSFRNTMPTRQLQSFQQQFYRTVTRQDQLIKTSVGHWQGIFRHVTRCQRERRIETSLTIVYHTRCGTSNGWYAAATTFEMGTKNRKIYLMNSNQVRKCRCEIDVETQEDMGRRRG